MSPVEATSPPGPATIYLCYIDKDEAWKKPIGKRLSAKESGGIQGLSFIGPLETPLPPDWKGSVLQALGVSTVAIVFLSKAFLDSEAKGQPLLRVLVKANREDGLPIIPVLVSPCPWKSDPLLSGLPVLPPDGRALDTLEGRELDEALTLLVERVREVVSSASAKPHKIIQMADATLRKVPVSSRPGELFEEMPPTVTPESVTTPAEEVKERLPPFSGDTTQGEDQLGITRDVNAFAAVLASKKLEPPLCLGIFGDWGTGKTFFMTKLEERIRLLGKETVEARKEGGKSAFCSHIAQITFNAWHYVDANLWASLACRIFEGLDEYITRVTEKPKETKAALFRKLQAAEKQREQAKKEQAEAQAVLDEAQERLVTLGTERENTCIALRDVWPSVVKKALEADDNTKSQLNRAAKELGVAPLTDSVDELQKALGDLSGLHGRIKMAWNALLGGRYPWWQMALLIVLVVVAPPLCAWLISTLLPSSIASHMGAFLGQVAALVASLAASVKLAVSWGGTAMKHFDDAKTKVNEILEKARAEKPAEEKALAEQLVALREREAAARRDMQTADEAVNQARQKLAELESVTSGRLMAELIRERVRSADYQSHLGIISTIRRDFQALSALLTNQEDGSGDTTETSDAKANSPAHMPKIDRIILYVDDLDRCPEDTVVQVLQAVHLLLYFKLFVVVIAVDSRWLVLSLKKQYVALQHSNDEATNGDLDRSALMSTTPQNYLEKIIQIPFNLRRMDANAFQRLVTSLMSVAPAEQEQPVQAAAPTDEKPAEPAETVMTPADTQQAEEMRPQETKTSGPPLALPQVEPLIEESSRERTEQPGEPNPEFSEDGQSDQSDGRPVPTNLERLDLLPASLELTREELTFMENISPMVSTPRSAKRLLNIYRLIRASVGPHELKAFLGENGARPAFEPVLVLLAVQIGFPQEAKKLFQLLADSDTGIKWGEFINKLETREPHTTNEPFGQTLEGSRLFECLAELRDGLIPECELGPFKAWLPRVVRYSFHRVD